MLKFYIKMIIQQKHFSPLKHLQIGDISAGVHFILFNI